MSKHHIESKQNAIDAKIRLVIADLRSKPGSDLTGLTQDDIEVFASLVDLSHEEQLFCIGEQFKRVLAAQTAA